MQVHSLTILHYGTDYLSYALRGVYDSVDKCHVFYTSTPSHGHTTNAPIPETRDRLLVAAFAYDPDKKVIWYDMSNVTHEGQQRDTALETVKNAGADIVLVLDYDEIWHNDTLNMFLKHAEESFVRDYLVNMTHLWRSFNHAIYDEGWPVRIINLKYNDGVSYIPSTWGHVYHFGYAIRDKIMRYKWEIHGHKNQLRPEWLDSVWSTAEPDNCHPTNGRNEVGKAFWTAKPFDKMTLPLFMRSHPFYDLERIE